jgi:PiT family inorganic phosphate transporter
MQSEITTVVFIIVVALIFDFINGFHDAANSIATVVSTHVLTPLQAVVWAAVFNFIAAFGFGVSVARTVGKGVVEATVVDQWVILAGLLGAIVWDLMTWHWGLPTSSSHALIGGFAGAAVAKAGFGSLIAAGLIKIGVFMILAPLIGLVVGYGLMLAALWACKDATPGTVDSIFRRLQLVSAGAYSLGHGTNDAQKTMGIIAMLLFTTGHLGAEFYVPFWVILAAHAAIGLGTLAGGWRIVKTMGMRITKLRPIGGFCAETAGALTLIGTAVGGIPVSTTHTITGAIMGVGAIQRLSAVRWGVAGRIVWAWIFTIPASALMAAATWFLLRSFGATSG